jgi:hypothetical protein
MTVAVVIPSNPCDEWRERALAYVRSWYTDVLGVEPIIGTCDGEWSKGTAIANGVAQTDADVLVLADADSFIQPHTVIAHAVNLVSDGRPWVMPHNSVYRLTDRETLRVTGGDEWGLRLARPAYRGTIGGGITVLTRNAYDTVNGVDPRYYGWGGEDVAFGYALTTLVGPLIRLHGRLIHLWHPHPAPNLRGSPASEALVAWYTAARDFPRRMRLLTRHVHPDPLPDVDDPVTFRTLHRSGGHASLKLSDGTIIQFKRNVFVTQDADLIDALRNGPKADHVIEVPA